MFLNDLQYCKRTNHGIMLLILGALKTRIFMKKAFFSDAGRTKHRNLHNRSIAKQTPSEGFLYSARDPTSVFCITAAATSEQVWRPKYESNASYAPRHEHFVIAD